MTQMERNLTDAADGFLHGYRHLIQDRSSLFTEQFREMLKTAGVESLTAPDTVARLERLREAFHSHDQGVVLGQPDPVWRIVLARSRLSVRWTLSSGTKTPRAREQNYPTWVCGVPTDWHYSFAPATRRPTLLLLPRCRMVFVSFEFVDTTGLEHGVRQFPSQ